MWASRGDEWGVWGWEEGREGVRVCVCVYVCMCVWVGVKARLASCGEISRGKGGGLKRWKRERGKEREGRERDRFRGSEGG